MVTQGFPASAQEGEQFQIDITSNSNVSNVGLHLEVKRVSLTVEG
ncbi:hypothetical protein [Nitrososphaera sp.]